MHPSLHFSLMAFDIIGYGDVLPETVGGKIFAIFFSFIGIPVCTYMVATVGSFLCMQFALLKYRVRKNLLKQQVEMKVSIYCVIQCTTITLLFVVMAGVIIATAEGTSYCFHYIKSSLSLVLSKPTFPSRLTLPRKTIQCEHSSGGQELIYANLSPLSIIP